MLMLRGRKQNQSKFSHYQFPLTLQFIGVWLNFITLIGSFYIQNDIIFIMELVETVFMWVLQHRNITLLLKQIHGNLNMLLFVRYVSQYIRLLHKHCQQLPLLLRKFDNDMDGLVQDCSVFCSLAMEILQSCTKPSIWLLHVKLPQNVEFVCIREQFRESQWEIGEKYIMIVPLK